MAFVACVAVIPSLSGCRSYNDHVWRTVSFVTEPDRATIFINGKNCGITPGKERMDRRGTYEIRFSKPGYFDEVVVLESFTNSDGAPDILDSVEVQLEKVTPEGLAARERLLSQGEKEATPLPVVPATEQGAMSPAAIAFEKQEKPINFTDFRLREKELLRLFNAGKITQEEYKKLHNDLCDSYNETRLLKAPRLGTYEQSR